MNDYFLLTTKLFSPLATVFDFNVIFSHLSKTNAVKADFIVVFMLVLAMPFGVESKSIRTTSSFLTSKIGCFNYLLNSTSVAGRGGGGGHGFSAQRMLNRGKHYFCRQYFLEKFTNNDYNLIKI